MLNEHDSVLVMAFLWPSLSNEAVDSVLSAMAEIPNAKCTREMPTSVLCTG